MIPSGRTLQRTPPLGPPRATRREEDGEGDEGTARGAAQGAPPQRRPVLQELPPKANVPVERPGDNPVAVARKPSERQDGKRGSPGESRRVTKRQRQEDTAPEGSRASASPQVLARNAARNVVPLGRQLARTPPDPRVPPVQAIPAGNQLARTPIATAGLAPQTSAAAGEAMSRDIVISETQRLARTPLAEAQPVQAASLAAIRRNVIPTGTQQLARTPPVTQEEQPIALTSTAAPLPAVAPAAAAPHNVIPTGTQQLARTPVSDEQPVPSLTTEAAAPLIQRNAIPTGTQQLARTPLVPQDPHARQEASQAAQRNVIPTGTQQLARTPVSDEQPIPSGSTEAAAPLIQRNVITTGAQQLARTPLVPQDPHARQEASQAAQRNVIPTGAQQLARTPVSDEQPVHSLTTEAAAPLIQRNAIPTGTQQLARTPLVPQDSHASQEESQAAQRNVIPTGTQQLARTPVSDEQPIPSGSTEAAAPLIQRNVIPTGAQQLARTPLVPQDPHARREESQAAQRNVIPTGAQQLARTPVSDNQAPMPASLATAAPVAQSDAAPADKQPAAKQRNVIPAGTQLTRTPLPTASAEEAAPGNSQALAPVAQTLTRAAPLRPVDDRPTLRNAIPAGKQLARTPLTGAPTVGRGGVLPATAEIPKPPPPRNMIPAGAQLARTPAGEAASETTAQPAAAAPPQEGSEDQSAMADGKQRTPVSSKDDDNVEPPGVKEATAADKLDGATRRQLARQRRDAALLDGATRRQMAREQRPGRRRREGLSQQIEAALAAEDSGMSDSGSEVASLPAADDGMSDVLSLPADDGMSEGTILPADDGAESDEWDGPTGSPERPDKSRDMTSVLRGLRELVEDMRDLQAEIRASGRTSGGRRDRRVAAWLVENAVLQNGEALSDDRLQQGINLVQAQLDDYAAPKEGARVHPVSSRQELQQPLSQKMNLAEVQQLLVRQWYMNQSFLQVIERKISECRAELSRVTDSAREPELQSLRIQHGCLQKELVKLQFQQSTQLNTHAVKRLLRRVELFLLRYQSLRRTSRHLGRLASAAPP